MNKLRRQFLAGIMSAVMLMGTIPAYAITPPDDLSNYTKLDAPGTAHTTIDLVVEREDPKYSYTINNHYDTDKVTETGEGVKGTQIPYDLTSPKAYNGHNYILKGFEVQKYVTENLDNNIANIYYSLDDKDKDGNNKPDGIPDEFQPSGGSGSGQDPDATYGYNVDYNYKDSDSTVENVPVSGNGTLGSAIPYSAPNTTERGSKTYVLQSLKVDSSIVTSNPSNNKVTVDYALSGSADDNSGSSDDGTGGDSDQPILKEKYTVTIDPDNGTGIINQTVTSGDRISKPADPEKSGYTFDKWINTSNNNTEFDFSTPITGATSIKAIYTVDTKEQVNYTVKHYQQNLLDDEYTLADTENLTAEEGSKVDATIKSYTGFHENTTHSDRLVTGTASEGLELRVYYDRNKITVTIDTGDGNPTTEEIKYGGTITKPSDPTHPTDPDNKTFDKWVDEDGNPVDFTKPVTGDITVTPTWTDKTPGGDDRDTVGFKVNHYQQNINGTDYDLKETENLEGRDGDSVKATTKNYTGFHVSEGNALEVLSGVLENGTDLVLRVYYDRNKITVTIDPDNGDTAREEEIVYGGTISKPSDPSKPGFTFDKWVDENGDPVDFTQPITGPITIKPNWTDDGSGGDVEVTYTVKHYQQNVAGTSYTLEDTETLKGNAGDTVNATVKSYTGFHENRDHSDRLVTGTLQEGTNLELRVYYDRDKITVIIDPDNGETPTEVEVNYGGTISKPADPTKPGNKFDNWVDGNGNTIDFTDPITESITIKPNWKADDSGDEDPDKPDDNEQVTYSIKHYKQDLDGINYTLATSDSLKVKEGTTVKATVKSYTGFHENASHPDRVISGSAIEGLELRVYYDRDTFTVTIDKTGNGDTTTQQVMYGDKIMKPADPTHPTDPENNKFGNWVDGSGNVVDFSKPVTGNMTIKPIWITKTPEPDNDKEECSYRVEHYQQNVSGSGYTLASSDTYKGKDNIAVTATAKNYTGFHENTTHADRYPTGVISKDKTLVLKLYYDRDIMTVTVNKDNGASNETISVRYGGTISAPTTPTKQGYKFTNWVDGNGLVFNFSNPITSNVTIKAEYTKSDAKMYNYTIYYHYDNRNTETVTGQAELGSRIPYTTNQRYYRGDTYTYVDRYVTSEYITENERQNKVEVYYELDNMGNHDDDGDGDGIPDKYQIAVYFRAVNGRLSHTVSILTLTDRRGNYSTSGTAELRSRDIPTARANSGYENGVWDVEPYSGMEVEDGDEFTIRFSKKSTTSRPSTTRPVTPVTPSNPSNPSGTINIGDGKTPLDQLPELNSSDHIAYISGYGDGLVGPNNNITRAQVCQIIYRLMTEEYRNYYYGTTNPFSDVSKDAWYNEAVSTAALAGIVKGYSDGSFGPNNPITRAEFAQIVSIFFNGASTVTSKFSDVNGHWAEKAINKAASAGWISGYNDGTFRPNNNITRAEAIAIINRILGRTVSANNMLPNMKTWPDNMDTSKWFYYDIQEATNGHTYEMRDGVEVWKTLK